jgi:hypothetical protein
MKYTFVVTVQFPNEANIPAEKFDELLKEKMSDTEKLFRELAEDGDKESIKTKIFTYRERNV